MKENLFIFLIIFLFNIGCRQKGNELEILESYRIPVLEISGMCWRANPHDKKRKEIIVIGDDSNFLYILDWERRKESLIITRIDIDSMIGAKGPYNGQWESVYSDESGRVFLLQEDPSRIIVINDKLTHIVSEINLNTKTKIASDIFWDNDKNSRGEGLLMLNNGHVLVTKEKKPFRIVEFAPIEDKSFGYTKNLSLEKEGLFPLKNNKELYANHYWKLPKNLDKTFSDASGINVGNENQLYLLSDKSNVIAYIGNELNPKSNVINILKLYILPKFFRKAEGMIIDDENRPIIALDQKENSKNNLFLLKALE